MRKTVPKEYQHLRPKTIAALRMRNFWNPRKDSYGALAPPERGYSGQVYVSNAYSGSAEHLAEIFSKCKRGFVYPRLGLGTPPIQELRERLLDLELGKDNPMRDDYDVVLTASGMSAIHLTALALADNFRSFLSSPYLYGGTSALFTERLPRLGITCNMVSNPLSISAWEDACIAHPDATFALVEDDANPTPIKFDNKRLANIMYRYGKFYICDRTIGTSFMEKVLLEGADGVIHSASKNIGGKSSALGGVFVGKKGIVDLMEPWFATTGPVMDARVADYMLDGVKSLPSRMAQKIENVKIVADFLRKDPMIKDLVSKVYGPGGDLIAFDINGTYEQAIQVFDAFQLIVQAPHLGDIWTLGIHPASTTHVIVPKEQREALGISDTLIRISVGLEDPQDIIGDIFQAFAKVF
jgi:methionine-gamma-lyase